jgi:hypothetical protein
MRSEFAVQRQPVVVSTYRQIRLDLNSGIYFTLPAGVGVDELAGPTGHSELLSVRPLGETPRDEDVHRLSLASVDGLRLAVPPGPVLVSLDLPWASWSQVVTVPLSGMVQVEFPARVGTPPLRVALTRYSHEVGRLILGADGRLDDPPQGVTVAATGRRTALRKLELPTAARWALAASEEGSFVSLQGEHPISFPLFRQRNFGVALEGMYPRVEPLSDVESPEWDLLVASGKLDALNPEAATALTEGKWFDELLGLASAYAVYACLQKDPQHFQPYLRTVLSNLQQRVDHSSPDLELLDLYLRHGPTGSFSADPVLKGLATTRAIPLFRWGVSLALGLLDRSEHRFSQQSGWRRRLTYIERRLSPASAWTVWTH